MTSIPPPVNKNSSRKRSRMAKQDNGYHDKKRARTGEALPSGYHDNETNDGLDIFSNGLVATSVLSFLNIRELLTMTNTSKHVREHLKYKHVIRGARRQDSSGHARRSLEGLIRLIQIRRIWTPSPMRLLRLVNAQRCEICNGNNHRGNQNQKNVRKCGLFLCGRNTCQDSVWRHAPVPVRPGVSSSSPLTMYWKSNIRNDPRVFQWHGYFPKSNVRDGSGERIGPLLGDMELSAVLKGETTLEEMLAEQNETDPYSEYAEEIIQAFQSS